VTKADLKKSHDEMAKFLLYLCRFSDIEHDAYRTGTTERHYQRARRLIKRAGLKYDPKTSHKQGAP